MSGGITTESSTTSSKSATPPPTLVDGGVAWDVTDTAGPTRVEVPEWVGDAR
jgi:hypothetical protein